MVLVFPISDQVNDEYRKLDPAFILYPQRKIREICEEFGIPMLDLTEALYRNGGETLFRDYLHLNSKGNDVIADVLEKYLVERFENPERSGEELILPAHPEPAGTPNFGVSTAESTYN